MFTTQNDLPADARRGVIELLNACLADAVDLQSLTKHAHWNVKGPQFHSLHKLFDELNEDVEDYVDDLAERVVQLGGVAEGTIRFAAQRSRLPMYPPKAVDGREHLVGMATALASFGANVRAAIDEAEQASDAVTADIFTEVSRGVDKWLWMVEAHLQAK